jgi:thioesterase domain-containing protein/acyl carrier protein
VPGELVIGGPGVALGYLGDPELTASRFRTIESGDVEYRTGDLVRRRHDEAIEFLGRLDRQVKLRGFRVEPGEIETHLTGHPRIDAAVVVPRQGPSGLRLVAYFAGTATAEEAAEHLRGRVPPFMVPAALVPLPELPLNPNGKVDVSALPEPVLSTTPYVAPSTDEERRMARLWEEVLEVERVGAADDFFERGGHSLLAIQLFAAIEDEFGVAAPLSTLFEVPTLGALTARIVGAGTTEEAPTAPPVVTIRPGADRVPLFCFPPAGGNVMVYEPMARAFGGERPILGIQAKGADGAAEPLRTIEEMAAYCEEAVVAVHPDGPYLFAGYSLGGLVAYETARRMRAAGHDVALVALIDARVIPSLDLRSEMRRDLTLIRRDGRRGLRAVGRRMAVRARRVAGRIRHDPKIVWYRLTGRPLSPLLAGRRLTAAGIEAAAGYQPLPYDGRVLYLVTEDPSAGWRRRAVEPWRRIVRGSFDVAGVSGTHKGPGSIMHEPNVERLAEYLRRAVTEGEGVR